MLSPVVLLLALGAVLVGLLWRLISRRQSIPCPSWLGWMVELDNPLARENRAATIVVRLRVPPGGRVLDFGCGPGRLTVPLARAVGPNGHVLAVDLQEGMLRRAAAQAHAAGLTNIRFRQAAAGQNRLGREEFDRAVLVTVLGEIPDRRTALRELHQALRPGGILSVTETVFDPHYQPAATVARLAAQAGFLPGPRHGNILAYTLHLLKPENTAPPADGDSPPGGVERSSQATGRDG